MQGDSEQTTNQTKPHFATSCVYWHL